MTTTTERLTNRIATMEDEARAIRDSERDEWDHGYRYTEVAPAVGEELEHSHERGEDGESLGELDGTSTFRTMAEAIRYAGHATTGAIIMVRGVDTGSGSVAGEQLLDEATVAAVWTI